MSVQLYGYCRVSARDQNEERQVIAMREFGIPEEDILVEKMSGKDFNRPVYKDLVAKLKSGDVLVIKSLDRLGRDYYEIIEQWRRITKEIKAAIVVIEMPVLDIWQKDRDLTAAKARGVKFGRRPKKRPAIFDAVYASWQRGEISAREATRKLGVSPTTFLTWIREK